MKSFLVLITAILIAATSHASWQSKMQRVAKSSQLGTGECSEVLYKDGLIQYSQGNSQEAYKIWLAGNVISPDHRKIQAALTKVKGQHPDLKNEQMSSKELKQRCYQQQYRDVDNRKIFHCDSVAVSTGPIRKHVMSESTDFHQLLDEGLSAYADMDFETAALIFERIEKIDPTFATASEYRKKCLEKIEKSKVEAGGK